LLPSSPQRSAASSSTEASRILLQELVEAIVPEGDPQFVDVEQTLERRQGKKIAAKGIYRDPVRSSHTHFVKTSALRRICVVLLAEVPCASHALYVADSGIVENGLACGEGANEGVGFVCEDPLVVGDGVVDARSLRFLGVPSFGYGGGEDLGHPGHRNLP
jgi:hypothetical protein